MHSVEAISRSLQAALLRAIGRRRLYSAPPKWSRALFLSSTIKSDLSANLTSILSGLVRGTRERISDFLQFYQLSLLSAAIRNLVRAAPESGGLLKRPPACARAQKEVAKGFLLPRMLRTRYQRFWENGAGASPESPYSPNEKASSFAHFDALLAYFNSIFKLTLMFYMMFF